MRSVMFTFTREIPLE